MLLLVLHIVTFALLTAVWVFADTEPRNKLILTGLFAASWLFLFVDGLLLAVAHGVLAAIYWFVAFGPSKR
jgi:hypothetical protein